MFRYTHGLIVAAYVSAPAVAVLLAIVGRNRAKLRGKLAVVGSAAVVLGSGLSFVYAIAMGGKISAGQVGLAIYLTASLLLLIMGLDWLLVSVMRLIWTRLARRTIASNLNTPAATNFTCRSRISNSSHATARKNPAFSWTSWAAWAGSSARRAPRNDYATWPPN